MERKAWKGRVKPGYEQEYIRRHDEIWPELIAVFKEAGICNYTIFSVENTLFGYYECEKGIAFADEVKAGSDVVKRWNSYMSDILELDVDPVVGTESTLKQVFRLE
ncbi:MAG: L-rhamnose mutarotase [Lachnospiraceae bacterium]|nr:L-rhamnose mutarotase [Lachnospiraceae bacterium]